MSEFFINAADRMRIATKWVEITLWALHIWASILVGAAFVVSETLGDVIVAMFSITVTGIGLTLALLLLDRAADAVLNRLSGHIPMAVKETATRTVTPVPTGDGNVQPTETVVS